MISWLCSKSWNNYKLWIQHSRIISRSPGRERLHKLNSNTKFTKRWFWTSIRHPLDFPLQIKYILPREVQTVPREYMDDKRQITGTLCASLPGYFWPPQLIYLGLTYRCHPKIKFPESFRITHPSNHWSNQDIVIEFFQEKIFPFLATNVKNWIFSRMRI